MIINKLRMIYKNQKGFAFTELLVAITVAALIAIAVTIGVFQIVTGNVRTSNHLTAVRQVQEAGYWVSHDTQMAEEVVTSAGNGFPLTLTWYEWDGSGKYDAIYDLQNMAVGSLKQFERQYIIYDANGLIIDDTTSILSRYIDEAQTSCNFNSGELVFTVTSIVGSGSQQANETRIYEVIPRLDS